MAIFELVAFALAALNASRATTATAMLAALRKAFAGAQIPCNPVGAGNSKTGVPSTYRPVGRTCGRCPYLDNGCYAQHGRVHLAQRRAGDDVLASVVAAIAASLVSLRTSGSAARLHVSGDFARDGVVDTHYVDALIEASEAIRAALGLAPNAMTMYSYTHLEGLDIERLAAAGITVLKSDALVAGGCILAEHSELGALRKSNPSLRFVACAAQASGGKVTCAQCQFCPKALAKGYTVVFEPHGTKASAAREASQALR